MEHRRLGWNKNVGTHRQPLDRAPSHKNTVFLEQNAYQTGRSADNQQVIAPMFRVRSLFPFFPWEIGASKIGLGLKFWDPPVAVRQGPASYKTLVSSSETPTKAGWILTQIKIIYCSLIPFIALLDLLKDRGPTHSQTPIGKKKKRRPKRKEEAPAQKIPGPGVSRTLRTILAHFPPGANAPEFLAKFD